MLAECWDAVRAFAAMQTQWRYGPSGAPTGLDYAGARAAVRAMGLKWRAVFEGVRVMEAETLEVTAARQSGRRGGR